MKPRPFTTRRHDHDLDLDRRLRQGLRCHPASHRGRACAYRISPNVLTFLGLVINTAAAILFGLANEHNYVRLFLYAGLVIIGAGIFDMVDRRGAADPPGYDFRSLLNVTR